MKKPLLIAILLLVQIIKVDAQATNDVNYVRSIDVTVEGKTTALAVENAPVGERVINYTYFDGLGRPIQNVTQQGSPLEGDIVQPIVYDEFGREKRKYLPFVAGTDGFYKPTEQIINQAGEYIGIAQPFYAEGSDNKIADSPYPYSETAFERSPLNRVLKQGAPGSAWQPNTDDSYSSTDRTIKKTYEANTAEDAVLLWTYSYPMEFPLGIANTTTEYAANELFKTRTKDEQHHEVIEYVDKEGKTVLKRVQAVGGTPAIDDTNYASTYYIYDDFGTLVCVIPPEATSRLSTEYYQPGSTNATKDAFLKKWAFRYVYDERRRMKLKQVPGADSVSMVYDKRDRLVLTQDGNQRSQNKWTFTKYDQLNRPIITGIYTHSTSVTSKEIGDEISATDFFEAYDGNASTHGYTNNLFPQSGTILTVTYYDNYDFRADLIGGTAFNFKPNVLDDQDATAFDRVVGQVTGTKINVLNTTDYLWGVTYYDPKYRPIQSINSNHRGAIVVTTTVVDFVGKVTRTKTTTSEPGKSDVVVQRRFEYDHAGRLVETFHKIDQGTQTGTEVLISQQTYNELGQLIAKKLHRKSGSRAVVDPLVGQPGVVYAADMVLTTFDPNVTAYVASNSITIQPGFTVPAGGNLVARLGYSQADADAINNAQVFAQEIDYRYNIRGWLDNINDVDAIESNDLFSMDLNYHNPLTNGGLAQFNGNISQARWKGPDGESKSYGYYYDPMNRLLRGKYFSATNPTRNGRFDELIGHETDPTKPAYDLNGNILNLFRNGKAGETLEGAVTYGAMDALSYSYTGNQLVRVTDNEVDTQGFKDGANSDDDYAYDVNGNMHMDKNKSLNANAITYNHLNLPHRVEKTATEYVQYVYDATGRKLKQVALEGTTKTTDYVGEFVYENNVLQFINTEEGRVVMTGSTPEYQYHLKDHLGNVRTTFTTKEETEAPVATLETANESDERAKFLKYDDVRKVNHAVFDHTNNGATKYAVRLTGTSAETYGLARSISVMPGDKIKAEVYAKYVDVDELSQGSPLLDLMNQISGAEPGLVLDGTAYGTPAAATIPFVSFLNKSSEGGVPPKAYLNWLVFDQDYNPIPSKSGYARVTTAAKETGAGFDQSPEGSSHELIQSPEIEIAEAGYVYIYFSMEEQGYEVYFDDFKVEHVKSSVVQSDDYYPFGLTFNHNAREHNLSNRYLFHGKEFIENLSLNWLDHGFRMYQPETGRFFQSDPLDQFSSPYIGLGNNPFNGIDPNGMWFFGLFGSTADERRERRAAQWANSNFYYSYIDSETNTLHYLDDVGGVYEGEDGVINQTGIVFQKKSVAINNKNFGLFGKYNKSGVGSKMSRRNREALDAQADGFLTDIGLDGGLGELNEIIQSEAIGLAAGQLITGISQIKLPKFGRGKKPVVVTISRSQYPEAAEHIEDALAAGHPAVGPLDRGGSRARRRQSLKGHQTVPGKDRDEFPPAVLSTGGIGASVRAISRHDNRGAGSSMGKQLLGVKDGTLVEIKVGD